MRAQRKVAVIVARQSSSRLPGKGMLPISGKPVVWHIINRLKLMGLFDEICVATSHLAEDRPLVDLAEACGVRGYAGHAEDVLERFAEAARTCSADVVVEVGGDCPLVDPNVARRALDILETENADYVTNVHPATYPDGIDMHALRMEALDFAARNAVLSSQRLHATSYFHTHEDRFKIVNFTNATDLSGYRWTLDYPEDFELISRIFEALNPINEIFTVEDVLALLERQPELNEINRKWAPAVNTGAAPLYWFNKTYWSDMLNDIKFLAQRCATLEQEKAYGRLSGHYAEMEQLTRELKSRAEHFEKH